MARKKSRGRWLYENSLVITMLTLFVVFLVGLSITGYRYNNEELQSHQQPSETYSEYIKSGDFVEAVFENWESEFLQMAALVVLTIFLRQKGSADSKKLKGKGEVDTSSRYSIIHASSAKNRLKGIGYALYANSLSIALIGLFALSFFLHAAGGTAARNEEAQQHGEQEITTLEYLGTSQFWYESFQNWQSEFLAVGTLLYLSIYLRQRGSPESKAMGESNRQTGV